jgi:hypothetical protein
MALYHSALASSSHLGYRTSTTVAPASVMAATADLITQSTSGSWPMKSRARPMRAPFSASLFRNAV